MNTERESHYLKTELYDLIKRDDSIFDFLQNTTMDGLWYWDLEHPENEWMNSRFWTLLGYDPEEMPHSSSAWQNIININDLNDAKVNFDKHLKNPSHPFDQIVRYTHKNGSPLWVRCRGVAIRDKKGNPVRMLGAHNDITELKQYEMDLLLAKEAAEKAAEELAETKRRLKIQLDYILNPETNLKDFSITDIIDKSVLQSIQDGFSTATGVASVITDADGVPITEPSNFTGLCRLVRNTEIGNSLCRKSDRDIGLKAAEEHKPVIESCHSCGLIDAGAPIIVGGKLIAIWMIGQTNPGNTDEEKIAEYSEEIGADKKEMLIEYRKINTMSLDQFNSIVNLLWLFSKEISSCAYNNILLAKKIEEQKEFELSLLKSKEKAEESDRLKTAFLSNISHEIRTPLNGILGFIDILFENNASPEDKKLYLNLIHQSSDRLLDAINNIIEISMIETAQLDLIESELAINDLFKDLIRRFISEAEEKGLYLTVIPDKSTEGLKIVTDKNKLLSVFINLIDNSLKYTSNGGISIGCTLDSGQILFFVKDTGVGINNTRIKSIFNPFEQEELDYNRTFEGVGLGLAISKAYVEMLGGKLWVESKRELVSEGKSGWSKFAFSLPIN